MPAMEVLGWIFESQPSNKRLRRRPGIDRLFEKHKKLRSLPPKNELPAARTSIDNDGPHRGRCGRSAGAEPTHHRGAMWRIERCSAGKCSSPAAPGAHQRVIGGRE